MMPIESTPPLPLRAVDPTSDLNAIADLVELCFASTIDADGKEYIRYLRWMAGSRLFHFVQENSAQKPNAVEGFVWEENGNIVGNLTLIPCSTDKHTRYLIANVAVHPDHRRRGIAKQLTLSALQETRRRQAISTWLHVHSNNPGAIHLYESLGFVEKTRRTTWLLDPPILPTNGADPRFSYSSRSRLEWGQQVEWLRVNYPPELRWNLLLEEKRFIPNFWMQVKDWFASDPVMHFSMHKGQRLKGLVTWEPTSRRTDTLWLSCPPEADEDVIRNLIPYTLRHIPASRPMSVNFPVDRGSQAFLDMGFSMQNTLIWMEFVQMEST